MNFDTGTTETVTGYTQVPTEAPVPKQNEDGRLRETFDNNTMRFMFMLPQEAQKEYFESRINELRLFEKSKDNMRSAFESFLEATHRMRMKNLENRKTGDDA